MICHVGSDNITWNEVHRGILFDRRLSADHGNDLVVLLFCSFFFLALAIFRESSVKMDLKNCKWYCKKQI